MWATLAQFIMSQKQSRLRCEYKYINFPSLFQRQPFPKLLKGESSVVVFWVMLHFIPTFSSHSLFRLPRHAVYCSVSGLHAATPFLPLVWLAMLPLLSLKKSFKHSAQQPLQGQQPFCTSVRCIHNSKIITTPVSACFSDQVLRNTMIITKFPFLSLYSSSISLISPYYQNWL